MSVTFVGLGLNDEKGLTLEGLEEARNADAVFAEFYTNLMPGLDRGRLEDLLGKKIVVLSRIQLEDDGAREIIEAALTKKVVFLVPGDPMIATTHISVRLELSKRGIPSRIIHAPSIASAVCGATGLQSYKFGKSVTLPQEPNVPRSVLDTLQENKKRGLHTLMLLDVRPSEPKQLTIGSAVAKLTAEDPSLGLWTGIGAARVGSPDQFLLCGKFGSLKQKEFGNVPHCLVFPGRLHFMEIESLKAFCDAKDGDLESLK
jgi:diphthine synthase